jgi:hypothetical protein
MRDELISFENICNVMEQVWVYLYILLFRLLLYVFCYYWPQMNVHIVVLRPVVLPIPYEQLSRGVSGIGEKQWIFGVSFLLVSAVDTGL